MAVRNPLRSALQAMGGPSALIAAADANQAKLVTCRLPKDRILDRQLYLYTYTDLVQFSPIRYAYVTGLEGHVATRTPIYVNGNVAQTLQPGNLFRIRWDWDSTRGVHVNAEFFGETAQTKIAFLPNQWRPVPTNPETYQRAISQQSQRLNYNTEIDPNKLPEERTGRPQNEQQSTLNELAKELAKE